MLYICEVWFRISCLLLLFDTEKLSSSVNENKPITEAKILLIYIYSCVNNKVVLVIEKVLTQGGYQCTEFCFDQNKRHQLNRCFGFDQTRRWYVELCIRRHPLLFGSIAFL